MQRRPEGRSKSKYGDRLQATDVLHVYVTIVDVKPLEKEYSFLHVSHFALLLLPSTGVKNIQMLLRFPRKEFRYVMLTYENN